ncbi:ATP-dependent DNA helicase [Agathobacter ruminis]|uniref:Helicase n=1 Tax=Agathobacter ruminis TaxID=1712665 RepID=A0A2G3E2X8_9FIRM|nr:ATP-dependent DNA helicase [Agathobacter ruminis]MDC7302298.1 ATP-dependent DNA helicase [Agathobacter ruminis]PHU37571.1 helicase [Agathobacter ruminis]
MPNVSVRNLVEFIFRSGDIDNRGRANSPEAMQEGLRIHRKIQKSMGTSYQAEVPLKYAKKYDEYDLVIEGRADGIFMEDQKTFVDEIKGMYQKVESFTEPIFVHQAQAMCYAFIFANDHALDEIGVQMTYVNLDTEEKKYFRFEYSFEEIQTWFEETLLAYKKWSDFEYHWKQKRNASIKPLEFPFPYREGQKKLVADVYRTIARGKTLFLQAPTGVGKTISTFFPAVKAVGENKGDRIFYLTAKTITASVAKETYDLLQTNGYQAKLIQLTAKEKLCPCETMECNPVQCPYAKGHFDRVNDAVFDILQHGNVFTREEILAQAERYQVCPFEMALDISSWCDDIICDYNYVFDPHVYLKRFFAEGTRGDYIFLVDEAHNLVDRSREMYSAELYKEDFLTMKRILKQYHPYLSKLCEKCNKTMLEYKRECETYRTYEDIGGFLYSLMRLATELNEFQKKHPEYPERKEVTEFYFALRNFLEIYDLTAEKYVIYTEQTEDGRFRIKLFNVDPSENLQNCIDKARATIFFSATLLPIQYYKRLLSTRTDNYAVYAHSVFEKEQSLIAFGNDVSTKYTERGRASYEKIAEYLIRVVMEKQGNYMAFFPSYRMMQDVAAVFEERCEESTLPVKMLLQTNHMNEAQREEFLAQFEEQTDDSLLAFCVMGGIFGEGIDLKEDRLIGAIVVGTGLPQVSNEQEILKNYYDSNDESGFDYAYRYPGLNKVLQAAGRVIRTTSDRGIMILLDRRFLSHEYKGLFPIEWEHARTVNCEQISEVVRKFWQND